MRWGNPNAANVAEPIGAVGEAHQALLNVQGPSGFQPYFRPKYFHVRVSVHVLTLLLVLCHTYSCVVGGYPRSQINPIDIEI